MNLTLSHSHHLGPMLMFVTTGAILTGICAMALGWTMNFYLARQKRWGAISGWSFFCGAAAGVFWCVAGLSIGGHEGAHQAFQNINLMCLCAFGMGLLIAAYGECERRGW